MKYLLLSIMLLAASASYAQEKTNLCTQYELIENYFINNGPIKGCKQGSILHLQIDPKNVAYSFVIARYCNFNKQIIIERHPTKKLGPVHIVCEYQFHEKE